MIRETTFEKLVNTIEAAIKDLYLLPGSTFKIWADPWVNDVYAVRVTEKKGLSFDLLVDLTKVEPEVVEVEFTSWPPTSSL